MFSFIYKNIIFCTSILVLVISNGSVGGNMQLVGETKLKVIQTKMAGHPCSSNPPILNSFAGAGHVDKIGGLNAYLTGSPHSTRAILFVSDIYGYEAPIIRKFADKVAAAGYYVVVPDYFNGDPFDPDHVDRPLPIWMEDHRPEKGFEASKPIIEALKSKGISAIGAAGYCWGAKTVCGLAKFKLIQTVVLAHPSSITVEDIDDINIPIAILGAGDDTITPPEVIKQFERVLVAKPGVDSFVKIFPNVSHGWTLRYDTEDPEAVKAAEEAHQIILEWFVKHIKDVKINVI
ncbi:endo-1,3;1,4-beta-D-glucanase-like isoform X1 [Trifolium pratense]|uniref:endo-1,3;1,4-beta-D-glucanase-like isoform X1 n=1 Tax=Trifolium pratense TaxID=57577 RepID=UPI001E6925A6|nr:endo-1,3;1,4-beta-D-glucanase-like isoform X1 [Trifolium pratense]